MISYKNIHDPITGQLHSIYSQQGVAILKHYVYNIIYHNQSIRWRGCRSYIG